MKSTILEKAPEKRRVALMQPYFFPYLGYFQLIHAVDTFIFYDDVNFIKNGWVNRNRILVNSRDLLFSIPCRGISPNKWINHIEVDWNNRAISKLIKTLQQAYRSAPEFSPVMALLEQVFSTRSRTISELAIESIKAVCNYLGLNRTFKCSSQDHPNPNCLGGQERVIDICLKENASIYINAIGGKDLYQAEAFTKEKISLYFIKSNSFEYNQFGSTFVPNLSIIDVLMFNGRSKINDILLKNYDLIE